MSARLASLILANSLLLGASLGFIAPSFAAIYMKLGDIKGEATESNHKGWIEIDSVSLGAGRAGAAASARTAAPSGPGTISFARRGDSSSAALMEYCRTRRAISRVEIHVVEESARYVFQDAIITSCQGPGQGTNTAPTESISLNYQKMQVDYQTQDSKGARGGVGPTYDLGTAKK
jgi:type VI secretion system secreted protein Hcp